MSRQRLAALEAGLEGVGFTRLPSSDGDDGFTLQADELTWRVQRPGCAELHLDMWATGSLGESTNDLNDLRWCALRGTGETLHFSKITSEAWRLELAQFVILVAAHSRRG